MTTKKLEHVLFITVDQMRAECLSMLGHECVETPNLDRLAGDGVLFKNHFAQAVPCGPSRASMLTGLYVQNHRSGYNGAPLNKRHFTLPDGLRANGIRPLLFGYTDTTIDPTTLADADPDRGKYETVMRGFDPICRMEADDLYPWRAYLRNKGYDFADTYDANDLYQVDSTDAIRPMLAPTKVKADDTDTAFLFDQTTSHLATRPEREPLLTLLTPYRPHPPITAPYPYNVKYANADLPAYKRHDTVDGDKSQHPLLGALIDQQSGGKGIEGASAYDLHSDDTTDTDDLRRVYYGLINELDVHMGKLLDFLDESGKRERTLIIFTADHGEMLGDHWITSKQNPYDASVHVPLIIYDPRKDADATRGTVVESFTHHVDLLPTILDWTDTPIPHQLDGQSLMPFVHGNPPKNWRDFAYWEFEYGLYVGDTLSDDKQLDDYRRMASIMRTTDYKYVHCSDMPPILYDLQKDPDELYNVAEDPKYQSIRQGMAEKLLSHKMQHADMTFAPEYSDS